MRVLRFTAMPALVAASILLGPAIPALASPFIPLPTVPDSARVGVPIPAPMPVIPQHARSSGPALNIMVRGGHQVHVTGGDNQFSVVVRNHGRQETRHVSVMLEFPGQFSVSNGKVNWPNGSVMWFGDIKPQRQELPASAACAVPAPVSARACGAPLARAPHSLRWYPGE